MAKIKRKVGLDMTREVARWVRERKTPKDDLTASTREEFLLRSDGVILHRRVVEFRPTAYTDGKGRLHDYGWKHWGTAAGADQEAQDRITSNLCGRGFTRAKP